MTGDCAVRRWLDLLLMTILIQHENPGADKQANWLPAPAEAFNLTMRLYGSGSQILDGSYRLPAVVRA